MNSLHVLVVLACAAALTAAQQNVRDPCAGVTCQFVAGTSCYGGIGLFLDRTDMTGCCPACVIEVARGQTCSQNFLDNILGFALRASLPILRCAEGTTCQSTGRGFLCQ